MIFSAIVGFFQGILGKKVLGYTIGSILTATLTAATFIMGVKAYRTMKDMQSRGQEILANKTSAGGKIPVIYGARRVGTQIIYMDTASNNSKELFVLAISKTIRPPNKLIAVSIVAIPESMYSLKN